MIMAFKPNQRFKRKYERIFRQHPEAANLFLLLAELADTNGQVVTDERELTRLFAARFNRPDEYAMGGDGK